MGLVISDALEKKALQTMDNADLTMATLNATLRETTKKLDVIMAEATELIRNGNALLVEIRAMGAAVRAVRDAK